MPLCFTRVRSRCVHRRRTPVTQGLEYGTFVGWTLFVALSFGVATAASSADRGRPSTREHAPALGRARRRDSSRAASARAHDVSRLGTRGRVCGRVHALATYCRPASFSGRRSSPCLVSPGARIGDGVFRSSSLTWVSVSAPFVPFFLCVRPLYFSHLLAAYRL